MRQLTTTLAVFGVCVSSLSLTATGQTTVAPTAELDRFMEQALARRDDNWKKLQQYIFDEEERIAFRGPGETLLWGTKREYLWYPREGIFVRSPVRFNGVAVGDVEREKYEQDFLRRTRERDERAKPQTNEPGPDDLGTLIQQTREPQFVSSAYLLQFKFEAGRYALVGRERVDGRDMLRIEYYPTALFSSEPRTRAEARGRQAATGRSKEEAYGAEMQRLMNTVSLVTIWVEPDTRQIVKYTFENAGLEFLPASWLVRVTDLRTHMQMTEAFPGVWLPRRVDVAGAFALAPGAFSVTYDIVYSGYREAAASGKYLGPTTR